MTSFQSVPADYPSSVPTITNNKTGAIVQDAFQTFGLPLGARDILRMAVAREVRE